MQLPLPQRQCITVIAAFAAITVAIYGYSLTNDFVYYDDPYLILNNTIVHTINPQTIFKAFSSYDPELYIPFTLLTYQFDWLIGNGSAWTFHLTSLLLHTVNALLVSWLILLLSKRKDIALWCGILFAIHPLHTETIAWASARKDVLFSMFYLGSLIAYIHQEKKVSLALFTCALMAKITAITLPATIMLMRWHQGEKQSKDIIGYIIIAIIFGAIAIGGKTETVASITIVQTVLMACKSTVFYLQKLIVPTQLSALYPYTDSITIRNSDFWLPALITAGTLGVAIQALKTHRNIAWCLPFFFITLAPTYLSFVQGESFSDVFFASDRYAYLPSIGIIYLVVIALHKVPKNTIILLGISSVFSVATYYQSQIWNNTTTLFTHTIHLYNNSHLAHNTLGAALAQEGKTDQALSHLSQSLALRKTARAYYNIGLLELQRENTTVAEDNFRKAIDMKSSHAAAHMNLGVLLWDRNEKIEGMHHMKQAVALNPDDIDASINLAVMHMNEGNTENAAILIESILEKSPGNKQALMLAKKIVNTSSREKK